MKALRSIFKTLTSSFATLFLNNRLIENGRDPP